MDKEYEQERDGRIRQRAYRMWQDEGCPEGRADAHWDNAAELVAIEDNYQYATERVPSPSEFGPTGEPVEPIQAVANLGEFPTAMTDQGDEQPYPTPRQATVSGAARKGQ